MITDERLKEIAVYWKGPGLTTAIKGSEIGKMADELLLLRSEVKAAAAMRVVFDRLSTHQNDHGPIRAYDEAVDTRRKAGY